MSDPQQDRMGDEEGESALDKAAEDGRLAAAAGTTGVQGSGQETGDDYEERDREEGGRA